jgi:hypothetical protein
MWPRTCAIRCEWPGVSYVRLAGGGLNHTPLLPGLAVSGLKTESTEIDLLCELGCRGSLTIPTSSFASGLMDYFFGQSTASAVISPAGAKANAPSLMR